MKKVVLYLSMSLDVDVSSHREPRCVAIAEEA